MKEKVVSYSMLSYVRTGVPISFWFLYCERMNVATLQNSDFFSSLVIRQKVNLKTVVTRK